VRGELRAGQLVISLAAAVTLKSLEDTAGPAAVMRVMPNTPALVGQAMDLVAFGTRITSQEERRAKQVLNVLGEWRQVPEEEMTAWCALCAVGPTYLLPVIEVLASSAVARGVPTEAALPAVCQMVQGTAQMVRDSGRSLEQLKQMISLKTLREEEAKQLFSAAYNDAVDKLDGLARKLGEQP
jgi:pyrroline-5-carboxylate reductase